MAALRLAAAAAGRPGRPDAVRPSRPAARAGATRRPSRSGEFRPRPPPPSRRRQRKNRPRDPPGSDALRAPTTADAARTATPASWPQRAAAALGAARTDSCDGSRAAWLGDGSRWAAAWLAGAATPAAACAAELRLPGCLQRRRRQGSKSLGLPTRARAISAFEVCHRIIRASPIPSGSGQLRRARSSLRPPWPANAGRRPAWSPRRHIGALARLAHAEMSLTAPSSA